MSLARQQEKMLLWAINKGEKLIYYGEANLEHISRLFYASNNRVSVVAFAGRGENIHVPYVILILILKILT